MKKKMFFKMGVALLLSLAVLVGLSGCGAKPSAPTDEGGNTIQEDTNTGNPVEDAAATNNLPEQGPDEINVDNGHDLTPQVDGPPYAYEVGGVNFECDINIYDYIYEKNGRLHFDLKKMAEDNGYNTEYLTAQYFSNQIYCELEDGSKTIISFKAAKEPYDSEHHRIVEVIGISNSNNSSITYLVKKYSSNDVDYELSDVAGIQMVSLNQIIVFAYMLDISPQQGSNLSPELIASFTEESSGRYIIP